MSSYFESELHRIIAMAEENEKIASEYSRKFFRIFLTVSEAREILEIIKNCKEYDGYQSEGACRSSSIS